MKNTRTQKELLTVDERIVRYANRSARVERKVVSRVSRGSVLLMDGKFLTPEEIKERTQALIPVLANFC